MAATSAFAKGGAGIDSVELREVAIPEPGPGEALVRLKAATLNFRDLLFVNGVLPGMTKQPEYVPLSCATGEVLAVGEGVARVKAGDRVNPLFHQGLAAGARNSPDMLGGSADGVARTHAVFPAESLCLVPDELGDLEAATLPCAALTAWSALFDARPLKAGERVLVQGAGGVSIAALQWAKAAGAEVIITSSSDAKLKRAKALGADVGVNYRTSPDWAKAVRAASGGRGVDIVVDTAGASELEASASLLNDGGVIAAIGMLGGDFSWNRQIDKPIVPISVGDREQHEAMLAFAARRGIRPVVDVVFDLTRLTDAMRCLESKQFFGKVGVNLR
ncbi:MAG TPA: NAD(P)-dependent alcohol dehydrogenase [Phenylobacterium sp.]|uniref:zinc-dependent alcohol dehydrogenase family protein n=1 Tax=Phenylobacterium sp. TaxID=1871053 RepID=UPI002B45E844|nr:NAD(P)-dependent alcohol dehydrogenase [Phenylobacterium sp.]HKR88131.1 NAD(P)-dependent alcohol dehydrogenase [Phenylobacterium sp.]